MFFTGDLSGPKSMSSKRHQAPEIETSVEQRTYDEHAESAKIDRHDDYFQPVLSLNIILAWSSMVQERINARGSD
jgi:hypothetical protein